MACLLVALLPAVYLSHGHASLEQGLSVRFAGSIRVEANVRPTTCASKARIKGAISTKLKLWREFFCGRHVFLFLQIQAFFVKITDTESF